MEIKRNGALPSAKGPAEWFTGTVRIDSPFKPEFRPQNVIFGRESP